MRFDILTLFPEMFAGPLTESIIKRAVQAGYLDIALHNIRDWATDKHKTVDDTPYGGGAGMMMKPVPLAAAIRAVKGMQETADRRQETGDRGQEPASAVTYPLSPVTLTVYLSPEGMPFTQRIAEELATYERLVLVCGRYEGIDERIRTSLIDRELSVGDFVLTGGELAAMIVLDVVARLVPGVLDELSPVEESFGGGLLEYPQYTRPGVWEGQTVPEVLLSGNHAEIEKWRRRQRLERTFRRRPDLLRTAQLSRSDREYLAKLGWQPNQSQTDTEP